MKDKNWAAPYHVRTTRERWKVAHAVANVMGCGSREAWDWMRTLHANGVNLRRLAEADVIEVDKARKIMVEGVKLPPKEKWESPVKKSARKALRVLKEQGPEFATIAQVQIMCWALGKIGSPSRARDALERAIKAVEEVQPKAVTTDDWTELGEDNEDEVLQEGAEDHGPDQHSDTPEDAPTGDQALPPAR